MRWKIETDRLQCIWPLGFSVRGTPFYGDWAFELFDGSTMSDAMVFFVGPYLREDAPAPDQLVGMGQSVIDEDMDDGEMWLELEYEHGGVPWRQRRQFVTVEHDMVVVVTGQAPFGQHEAVFNAVDQVAKSVRYI